MSQHLRADNPSQFVIRYSRSRRQCPFRLSALAKGVLEKPREDNKFDTIALLMHCPRHESIAVYQDPATGIRWLPFTPLFPEKSWTESAVTGALLVLSDSDENYQSLRSGQSPFCSVQLLEIQRIQLPQTLAFLTRYLFYTKLRADLAECCAPNATNAITWLPLTQLVTELVQFDDIWGPELVQYSRLVANKFHDFRERIEEFSLDDVYLYSPRDPPRNAEETMLLELNISEKTIEILYNDFLDHCYPCFSMPLDSFKRYLTNYGLPIQDERLNSLFMAFNYQRNGYISFHELLLGLASLEPLAPHNETRIKFCFRFYDTGSKQHLDYTDFSKMVADIFPQLDEAELKVKLDEYLVAVGADPGTPDSLQIAFKEFANAIKAHTLRGTSKLCRSAVPVFLQLTRAFIHKGKKLLTEGGVIGKEWNDMKAVVKQRAHSGICPKCLSFKPRLATHSVNIDAQGYIGKPVRIATRESSAAPIDPYSVDIVFNEDSLPNRLIRLVRQFNRTKGTVAEPRGLLDDKPTVMLEMVTKLADLIRPVLKAEPRCAPVQSPCVVLGDIHGNLEDLLTLERTLWRAMPCLGASLLFLGDYVDRGKWGLECALYLLSLKCLLPHKVTLLRGNHEVRNLQEKYSYKRECLQKYGPETGDRIWAATNTMFDQLPVAATVDSAIFCVHGGLSPNAPTVESINRLANPLENPEVAPIAWELLWSDPCHLQQYLDLMQWTEVATAGDTIAQQGFLPNQKRGAAFLFNERATSAFLAGNGLSHMIRAHEVPPAGFTHHFNNLCTTVFSCSHYCNNENEAACILLDDNRIRAIRIDTADNAPATE